MVHVLIRCWDTANTTTRILPDGFRTLAKYFPRNELLNQPNHQVLTQIILDCTSLNLPMNVCTPPNHGHISYIMQMYCHLCYGIHQERLRKLKELCLSKENDPKRTPGAIVLTMHTLQIVILYS